MKDELAAATACSRSTVRLDVLDQRFARGEIDKTEYEEKRKLIGQ